ncbi:MAG: GspMb/PilO family protein [Terriglobales bacterium]
MSDIKQTRRRFKVVLTILLCLDVAAVAILVSPIGRASRAGRAEVERLWQELRAKDREVLPLRGIDAKVIEADQQIQNFYETRLPASYAAIAEKIGKLAAANGVDVAAIQYSTKPAGIEGLDRVSMQLALSGDYLQQIKLINAIERDKTFFLVAGVNLQEVGRSAGTVRLQLDLETYLKPAA